MWLIHKRKRRNWKNFWNTTGMERVVTNKWRNTFKIRSLSVTCQDKYTKLNFFFLFKKILFIIIIGRGGGRWVRDWEHLYTRGGFMLMCGKTNINLIL